MFVKLMYNSWESHMLLYIKGKNGRMILESIENGSLVYPTVEENGQIRKKKFVEFTEQEQLQDDCDVQATNIVLQGLLLDVRRRLSCSTNGKGLLPIKGNRLSLTIIPEWSRHVTIVHQTKDLHTADYTQLYDFLKYNQKQLDELKAERLAKTQDPLALMANSNNPYMVGDNGGNQFRQYARQNAGNLTGYNDVQNIRNQNQIGNGNFMAARAEGNAAGPGRRDAAYLQTQLLIAQKEEATDNAPAYDSDGSAENLAIEVEKVNSVDRKLKETNADLTTELARFKNQTRCFEISQEKYDKLERCYQQSVYQEQCLFKKINALHLSTGKQIMTLNEQILDINKQLLKEKSTVSFLFEEKKRLKSDFKTREDELLDKQIQLEKRIKELNNILVKTGQSIQMIHMLSPKPDSFYHTEQKMALGYQNLFYLKQAQKKQQSLYNGKVLLEKHDPSVVHDLEETLQLAQESREKMKQMNKEIKPANYIKINHLSGVFVLQTTKSHEELYFSNISKTANVSKSISIPNEDFSDDTTPSVARKFLNKVKSTIVTLQRVAKHRMTIETHNWSSSAHQELHKIIRDENFPIVNHVDARVQNFERQFLKEAAKFVGDFKYIANEVDASLAKHKALELEIERLLKAVVSDQKDNTHDTSANTMFAKQPIVENLPKVGETHALSKLVTSNSVSTPQEPKGVNNDKVIALGIFRINLDKTSREKKVPNTVSASNRTKPITISQPPVFIKKDVNSDLNGLSSIGVDNTKTRRLQPRSNSKHDRVLSASTSSQSKNKEAEVEEHHRNLLLSKNNKYISSACNNIKIDSQDVLSKVVCAMCKQCLISVNHDVCLRNYMNVKKSRRKKQMVKVSVKENKMKYLPKVTKPKKVGFLERLVTPKPRKPRFLFRWSTTGRLFDQEGKIVNSSESESQSDCFNGDKTCCSKHMTGNLKLLINFIWKFMGTVHFGNNHVAAILGFGDLQWGNILITRVYFVEGLGHNLFSVGQLCDSDLEVAFRRNVCFVRNIEGVDLLKGDRLTNLYTINLHEMASASPICLMAHASSTKLWLWHQRLSHLTFDTINDLARNDLVSGSDDGVTTSFQLS
uniref:Integrase, catalytic region, zinc finger, CCHC-type, peptidase aspartic, catalytic n=1 Tax=Tanacetum cinerariifolium TaxID=118510 RepID=A0A6L2JX79_TANCI|nr:integrase, catalytic region, zinc finger, CCHC-type, peptidase aspartic, catalytic [Tanacetum cinerariifolium]